MAFFIGRISEMRDLTAKMQQHKIVVIHGFKGIGKSTLAMELCRQIQHPYHWFDLRNISSADEILHYLVRTVLQETVVLDDPKELLAIVCENIARQGYDLMIVFDNAEDVLRNNDSTFFVEILLSLSHVINARILVTSNVKLPVHRAEICDFVLEELCFNDSYDLLKRVCPLLKDAEKISAIVNLCEGIPLALILAGGEIGVLDADEVIFLLSKCRLKVLSPECYTRDEQIEPIYKGFLDRLPAALEEKLTVLNYIPGTFNIEEAVSVLGEAKGGSKDTVEIFYSRHLISKVSEERFNIHGILRDCLKEYFKIKDIKGVRSRFCKTFAAILNQIEQKSDTRDYADALCRLNVEYQNFRKLFTDVIYCTEDTYHVFIDLAATTIAGGSILFTKMATYDIGIQFYENCLKKAVEFKQELDEAKVQTGYGRVLTNIKGDYVQAEERFERAMDIRRRHPNQRDYFMALLCQSYGWNLGSQGKYVQALKILEEAYTVERELKMHYENLMLQTMQSLAIFYNWSGRFDKGEPLQLEVLKRRLHVIATENHPMIGSIMNNMGVLYERKGDFSKAAHYYRKGLIIKENTKAPIKAVIISEVNVARSILEEGQHDEAIALLQNGFERLEDFPGLFSDTRSLLWETMGNTYLKMNSIPDAAAAFEKAIDFRTRSSASDHSTLGLVCVYAKCLLAMSENERAVTEIHQGLRLCDSIIKNNPTNPTIVFTYEKLLEANFSLKRREDLENTYEAGKNEFFRLIKVYEDLRNFNKREDVLAHFRRFRQRYIGMKKQLEIYDPNQCSVTDNFILISLIGCKVILVAMFSLFINHKRK